MTLKRVRMELARNKEFPDGSAHRGYEFAAPLDDTGHLDAAEWRDNRDRCRVKRFWEGEANQIGKLVHKRGGSWAFDYNPEIDSDDEKGFKFSSHRFVPGEYISVTEQDGEMRTFRVVSVQDLD